MEHVNKPSFPNDSILVKHSCKITQNSLNPFHHMRKKIQGREGGGIPPKLCLLARCETGVWDTCDLQHLWECAANDRSEWKVSCSIPVLSLADNFSFGMIRGVGGCLSLLGRNQWATQRELLVNEPKDEVLCNWDTKRNVKIPAP